MKKVGYLLTSAFFGIYAKAASAQIDWGLNYARNVGLGTREIRDVAIDVIQAILSMLGIIALIIILYGGFKWMTAAGNEENISSAKKIITAGIVGLIIIFFAYAIVAFVFNVIGDKL